MAFNNAGIVGFTGDLADESAESFDKVTAINLRGIWTCMKHELRQMRTQDSGAIVNCSSLGGLVGQAGRASYHAAKHGVIGLTKSAAMDYAPRGIRAARHDPPERPAANLSGVWRCGLARPDCHLDLSGPSEDPQCREGPTGVGAGPLR
jgi:NADP-dependent 3-hydroxy acid dehydrogenase YdfG